MAIKPKSSVNEAGNYTKPTMRKSLFEKIKQGQRAATQANGRPEKHNCWR
jgi:hypothetical protein